MFKKFIALAILDIQLCWKQCALQVVWLCALPFIVRAAYHDEDIAALAYIFVILLESCINLPARIIAEDRQKGTIWLLIGLPMRRLELAVMKWLEGVLFSLSASGLSFVVLALLGVFTTSVAVHWICYSLPAIASLTLIASGAFFLLSERIARLLLSSMVMVWAASAFYNPAFLSFLASPAWYATVAIVAVVVGAIIFVTSVWLWAVRPIPT